jgi:hypothetical protein
MSIAVLDINQLYPRICGELGVQAYHLNRKGDLVDDALPRPVTTREKLQVVDGVVLAVSVDMVNGFFGQKFTSEVLFHDVSVLKHFGLLPAVEISGDRKPNVATLFDVSSNFASEEAPLGNRSYRGVLAFNAAIFLLGVKFVVSGRPLIASALNLFPALLTRKGLSRFGVGTASKPGAGSRAVHRVAGIFAAVFGQETWFHSKWFAALLAGEHFGRDRTTRPSMKALVLFHAFFGAVVSGVSGFRSDEKRSAAIPAFLGYARVVVRHLTLQVFGNAMENARLTCPCQVLGAT